jgi:hypothetical protein
MIIFHIISLRQFPAVASNFSLDLPMLSYFVLNKAWNINFLCGYTIFKALDPLQSIVTSFKWQLFSKTGNINVLAGKSTPSNFIKVGFL